MVAHERQPMTDEQVKEIPLDRVRAHWTKAAGYPVNKEAIYHGHADAHEFAACKGKRILEYGCGGGSDTLSMLARGAHVAYADVVHSNVDVTRERVKANGWEERSTPLYLDASATIDLPSGSCDVVTSHGVLHHIVDPLPVLREFHRILKPHGRLLVMLYTEQLEHRLRKEIADNVLRHRLDRFEAFAWATDEKGAPYARSYTRVQGIKFLEDAGFTFESSVDYNRGDFRTFRAARP
jgi:2-polyprenyl-3-methyl-5-hydroxy-6-metoxy-1,4-benzoquinol methylase